MKKLMHFASTIRANVLLCAGAAALLTACGGNVDGQLGQNTQLAATAVDAAQAQPAPAAAAPADLAVVPAGEEQPTVAAAPADPAAVGTAAPGYAAGDASGAAQPGAAKANSFEMSGYGAPAADAAAGNAQGSSGTEGATGSASPDLRAAAGASPAVPLPADPDPNAQDATAGMF